MNKFTKLIALLLVAALSAALFAGCGTSQAVLDAKNAELCAGKWLTIEDDSEEQAQILLENIDLYEEEIALVDLTCLQYGCILEYNLAGTYRQYISEEHTKSCVRDFYEEAFAAMYAGRDSLAGLYEADLSAMTEEEFQLFYADLYGYETYAELITQFTDAAYDYSGMEDLESGTFTVEEEDSIYIVRDADATDLQSLGDNSGSVTFTIENGTLTLVYSDATVSYTDIG